MNYDDAVLALKQMHPLQLRELLEERDALRAKLAKAEDVCWAVWKDECKSTYCALQRGGMVHAPLLAWAAEHGIEGEAESLAAIRREEKPT